MSAERFADYWVDHGYSTERGHVYRARVRPEDVLAIVEPTETVTINGKVFGVKDEFEVIVDARSVPVTLVQTAEQRMALKAAEERREARLRAHLGLAREGLVGECD